MRELSKCALNTNMQIDLHSIELKAAALSSFLFVDMRKYKIRGIGK